MMVALFVMIGAVIGRDAGWIDLTGAHDSTISRDYVLRPFSSDGK